MADCTVSNFVQGCILDAHPLYVVFGALVFCLLLLACGVAIACAICAPLDAHWEKDRLQTQLALLRKEVKELESET